MLYRKYRPKTFAEVISQNHIKITIQNQIKTNKLGHAYLFCGPRAVGKTTLARIVAKTINCKNRAENTDDACNDCSSCKEINKNSGLDIMEIDAASHTGVDNVRENIIMMSQVAPSHYKYKVFIIDEVHMLSTQAFNALLKTVEEPPSYIVFILCTTEIHKVPLTIISRCQRFDFKKIGVSDITKKLENIAIKEEIKIEKKVLEAIARQSGGHMRDAESLLNQIISIGFTEENEEITMDKANLIIPRSDLDEAINLINYIFQKNTEQAIRLVNKLVDEGIDLKLFSCELIEILRKIVLAKTNQALAEKFSLELGENYEKKISEISKNINIDQLVIFIERLNIAKNELNKYPIPQLALELAIIELTTRNKPNVQQSATQNIKHTTHNTPSIHPVAQNTQNITNNTSNTQKTAQPTNQTVQQPSAKIPVNKTTDLPAVTLANEGQSNNITTESINAKWKDVLGSIQQTNPSVSFILRACKPHNAENNQLTLAFKYKFHQDQIERPEIKSLIMELLQKIYGQNIVIKTILDANLEINGAPVAQKPTQEKPIEQSPDNNNDDMMSDILNTFEGKVIN